MNEQEYMKITGGIDERFVAEYENFSARRVTSLRKRIGIGIAVAAAVALMVPAGVFAFTQLTHRDKVSIYYSEEGVRLLEENNTADVYTVENGKIRLTVDVQICDGNFVEGVYTLTALTEDAKDHLHTVNFYRVYADDNEYVWGAGGFGSSDGSTWTEDEVSWSFRFPVRGKAIDESRPMRIIFFEDFEKGEPFHYDGHTMSGDFTYYEGIYFDLITKPNIPVKTLRSEDGAEIVISHFGMSMIDENKDEPENGPTFSKINSMVIIASDGERYDILSELGLSKISMSAGGGSIIASNGKTIELYGDINNGKFSIRFGTAFDINNIKGIEINGVTYIAE